MSSKEPTHDAAAYIEKGQSLAEELVNALAARGKMIVAAESCTAGLSSDLIARIPGASNVFWGSFVSYTAEAKTKMLGVSEELIAKLGVVSQGVAQAMAEGALEKSGASWAFSITGFAGPGGGAQPAGTVWIGVAGLNEGSPCSLWSTAKKFFFNGSRNEVRKAAAAAALEELLEKILTGRKF